MKLMESRAVEVCPVNRRLRTLSKHCLRVSTCDQPTYVRTNNRKVIGTHNV